MSDLLHNTHFPGNSKALLIFVGLEGLSLPSKLHDINMFSDVLSLQAPFIVPASSDFVSTVFLLSQVRSGGQTQSVGGGQWSGWSTCPSGLLSSPVYTAKERCMQSESPWVDILKENKLGPFRCCKLVTLAPFGEHMVSSL